jgi:hypothetical protein
VSGVEFIGDAIGRTPIESWRPGPPSAAIWTHDQRSMLHVTAAGATAVFPACWQRATLGLDAAQRATLLSALAERERARSPSGSIGWVEPLIEVTGDVHGASVGAPRDAILCEVFLPRSAA